MTDTPLVSICTLTFNQAKFIRQCLDGFLMQERDFGIEILIHDDASTDGTVEILREYEAKYPNLIFPLYEAENQYTRGGAGKMDLFNYNRARGKYIAYCEGDDCWTDSNKLKRQVEFMEANDWCTVCFTRWKEYFVNSKKYGNDTCDELFTDDCDGVVLTPSLFFKRCYTASLTMLFRFSCYENEWRKHYSYYRDSHEIYHLLKKGNGYIMNFIGGQYNRHDGGISSGIPLKDSCQLELIIAKELYAYNSNDDTKMNLINILQWNINSSSQTGASVFSLSWERLALDKNIFKFIKNILVNYVTE